MPRLSLCLALLMSISPAHCTTIAFDGRLLAADSQITAGGSKYLQSVKIVRIGRAFVAAAGEMTQITRFRDWYEHGHDPRNYPKKLDEFTAIVVTPLGVTQYWDVGYGVPVPTPCAIGTGADAARGAMMAGVDAKRAVQIATRIDLYSGEPVIVHSIDELK